MVKSNSELNKRTFKGVFFTGVNIVFILFQVIFMPFDFKYAKVAEKISDATVHRVLIICGLIQFVFGFISFVKYKKALTNDISVHRKARHFNFIALMVSFVLIILIICVFSILAIATLFLTMDLWFRLFMPSFVLCSSSMIFLTIAFIQNNISD